MSLFTAPPIAASYNHLIFFYLTGAHFTAVFSWVMTRLLSIAFTQVDKKSINK